MLISNFSIDYLISYNIYWGVLLLFWFSYLNLALENRFLLKIVRIGAYSAFFFDSCWFYNFMSLIRLFFKFLLLSIAYSLKLSGSRLSYIFQNKKLNF